MERKTLAGLALAALAAAAAAFAARYGLVENEALLAACRAGGRGDCGLWLGAREAVVGLFFKGYLGWSALALSALALLAKLRPAAWGGWPLGIAGMILYNVEPAAVAALLALLLLARRPAGEGQQPA